MVENRELECSTGENGQALLAVLASVWLLPLACAVIETMSAKAFPKRVCVEFSLEG